MILHFHQYIQRFLVLLPEDNCGLRVLSLPASVCVSVRPCVNHELVRAMTHHPSKLGSTNLDHRCKNTLAKIPIVLGGDWPWPSRSNLTSKSRFTPFWACPCDNSSPRFFFFFFFFFFWGGGGLIALDMSNLTHFQNHVYLQHFCIFEILERPAKQWKMESVTHPKWLRTNMFAYSVVSWTVGQSSCIFSVTIAGFSVLDSAIGNGFLMLL